MGDFLEFEEGEVGDLSDFEEGSLVDSRSQPLTPVESESDFNSYHNASGSCKELKLHSQNSRNFSTKPGSFGQDVYVDDVDDNGRGSRSNRRPDSLLNLMSDDESGTIHKGRKKKKRKRDWNPPGSRHSIAKKEKAPCRFYLEGRCHKGTDCLFSHEIVQAKKQELCKFYATGSCSKGSGCTFLHAEFPCKFFHLSRNCYHGDICKFSHRPLTPASKILLDRFVNEKLSNSHPLDSVLPTRENIITTGPPQLPVLQSGANEPYGDIDYRRILSPSQASIPGQMCPQQPGMHIKFYPRPSFDYGPRCPPGSYALMRFPPNANFPTNMIPRNPSAYHEPHNGPRVSVMNGMPVRFRHHIQNSYNNGAFNVNSLSPHSETVADVCQDPQNSVGATLESHHLDRPPPPHDINVPTNQECAFSESIASASEPPPVVDGDDDEVRPSDQNLILQEDFVLPLRQENKGPSADQTYVKWFLLPLEIETKLPYASLIGSENNIPNDPRLLPKLPVDPRLKPGSIRGPTLPVNSVFSEESFKLTSSTPVESSTSEGLPQPKPTVFTSGRRRTKLQLNELANTFASGGSCSRESEPISSSATTTMVTDRPYLLDPRLKRRRIVAVPSKADENDKSQVLESPGASMQIAVHGPSA